ncbi:hypothetical protein K450DRAFT_283420 [Umbelopsis ramanniana AG]|uniref:Cytochrome b-c1 complex subunit 2, mitochondrial n=1 Tax=Umbelopsis ramanniana AG TaxID=1314678 RepID=A0AAD5E476_UMBRA|nr:uncharacterized protein K450DRAFT_283420 [Umbelopsis ramanniana AG]KAI8576432.1 hypothetical protein K450DRAFT_283420 [Umbelopsis ramanniana AG]
MNQLFKPLAYHSLVPVPLRSRSLHISRTLAGVTVATYPEPGLTAGLSVIVGGGPRYETEGTAGAAHFLKNYTFMNNQKRKALRIVREAELTSAILSRTLTHEYLSAQVQFLKGDEDYFSEILSDVICRQTYEPHEFPQVHERTKWQTQDAKRHINVEGLEKAHQLAFRNGLGNPLFSSHQDLVDHVKVRMFAKTIFTSSNIVVVGRGVDHKALLGYVHLYFDLNDPEQIKHPSTYYGGDVRTMNTNQNAHCTMAFRGFSSGSSAYYASKVLQEVLGGGNHLKWTTEQCKLAAVKSQISNESEITSFSIGYSDIGLFGLQLNTPNHDMGKAVKLTMDALATLKTHITDDEMQRAKNIAKMNFMNIAQSRLDSMDFVGFSILNGNTGNFEDILGSIDNVQKQDLHKVASDILSSKPTSVTIGNLHSIPYLDQYFGGNTT